MEQHALASDLSKDLPNCLTGSMYFAIFKFYYQGFLKWFYEFKTKTRKANVTTHRGMLKSIKIVFKIPGKFAKIAKSHLFS